MDNISIETTQLLPRRDESMNAIQTIYEVIGQPYDYARRTKRQTGKPVVGYFCSYTPEELIYAAGAIPFRLFGTRGDISAADAHLQSYCCSLVRGGLEDALNGRLDFLTGTVFPHTCDSIQRLSDIWRLNAGFSFHIDAVMPVKLDTESARIYMVEVLRQMKKELEAALGTRITDEKLHEAIAVYNRNREILSSIYDLKARHPHLISARDIYHILSASMMLDRGQLTDILSEVLKDANVSDKSQPLNRKKRIMLSGGICSHPDIYTLLEDAGADVVADDLCTGSRYFEGRIDPQGDPLEAIARRYMSRVVCPAKHSDVNARGRHLVEKVKQSDSDGVIFLLLKFCDPHAFDYPYLKQFLDDANVPSMLLEVEDQLPSEGQLKTRFETFVEML